MEPKLRSSADSKGIRKYFFKLLIPSTAALLLTGCGVIEGIFQAGFWLGIVLTVAIVSVLIWLAIKIFRKLK